MWIILIIIFAVLALVSLWSLIHGLRLKPKNDWYMTLGGVFLVASIVILIITGLDGLKQYGNIQPLKYDVTLENQNVNHYRVAMKYSKSDEKSEHHDKPTLTGNLGEPKDNGTWQQNYQKYYNAEHCRFYYRTQLHYCEHPLKNIKYFFYLIREQNAHPSLDENL